MSIHLFEYANKIHWTNPKAVQNLEKHLETIWHNRKQSPYWQYLQQTNAQLSNQNNENNQIQQGFISINRGNQLQACNYVGIINAPNFPSINLLPKIFYRANYTYTSQQIQHIFAHFIWWLSYCHKIQFPLSISNSYALKGNIMDVMIYHFALLCEQNVTKGFYKYFHSTTNEQSHIKGKLETTTYINKQLTRGMWHKPICTYSNWQQDNHFNQIIKYVCTQLLQTNTLATNKKKLQIVVEHLHMVSDVVCCASDCDKVQLNILEYHWEMVLQYCKIFLVGSAIPTKGLKTGAIMSFLLPMERIFEQFVYGFIQKHYGNLSIKFQDNSTFLALNAQKKPVFRLQQDIVIQLPNNSLIIIDTKYKMLNLQGNSKKIQATDVYQLAVYAIRRSCKQVFLFYPVLATHTLTPVNNEPYFLTIQERFSGKKIQVGIIGVTFGNHIFSTVYPNVLTGTFFEKQYNILEEQILQTLNKYVFN